MHFFPAAAIAFGLGPPSMAGAILPADIKEPLQSYSAKDGNQLFDGDVRVARFQEILAQRSEQIAMFRPRANPRVLVLNFPNLKLQGRMLNRIAALIEKKDAPKDVPLEDDALTDYIREKGQVVGTFYFGHDYRASALLRFFTLMQERGITANPEEQRLKSILIEQGFMLRDGDQLSLSLPEQALVTITALQRDDPATLVDETVDEGLRDTILRHELSHGEYFTNQAYRDFCTRFWHEELNETERQRFRRYLRQQDYDSKNEDLMINEMQAYLIHTPDPRAFAAHNLGMTEAELNEVRKRFYLAGPPSALLEEMAGTVTPLPEN